MRFDCHWEDWLLPLIHHGELIDLRVRFGKCRMEIRDFFVKKQDKDDGLVVENIGLYLIEQLNKIFVGSRDLQELE